MKKNAILFISCLLVWMSAQAESMLVLQMRDGQTHSYVLAEQPVMTFGQDMLIMTTPDAQASFAIADVENFHFDDSGSGIREVAAGERRFGYVSGVVTVEGSVSQVMLTDLSGRQIHATRSGESFTFDLRSLPAGTYLLRIDSECIKLYHK